MVIEEFGPRVANVWNHLRTTTRNLVENAWRSAGSGSAPQVPRSAPYDPRADQELGQLLAAVLRDPVDAVIARLALERQATEFGSEDAQRTLREAIEGFEENFD